MRTRNESKKTNFMTLLRGIKPVQSIGTRNEGDELGLGGHGGGESLQQGLRMGVGSRGKEDDSGSESIHL